MGERPERLRRAARATALAFALGVAPPICAGGAAQEPDTLAAQPQDTLTAPQDTLPAVADTATADSVVAAFPVFPDMASQSPGVAWQWDMPDILGTGALTFAQLVEFTTFLDPIRSGFLEGPQIAVFAGRGPASFRYNSEGYEIVPLLGGALDLRMIPLVQQERIRLIHEPGGFRVSDTNYRNKKKEPYSRIEAGTGDRRTNLLRGYISSKISKASVSFGLDRVDTNGTIGFSRRTAILATVAYPFPWGVWGQLEYRSASADRENFLNPQRTDWILRFRKAFSHGWHADVVAGSARLEEEDILSGADTLREEASARQVALRGARTGEHWQTYLSVRFWDGEKVPKVEPEAALQVQYGPASLFASGRFAYWKKTFETAAGYASLTIDLPLRLRVMGEVEEGDRGLYGFDPIPWMEFGRWTLGGDARLWSWRLGARYGRWRSTPSPGLGEPVDSVASLPGGEVAVVEAWAGGPLFKLFGGTADLGGRYSAREDGRFLYWPKEGWRVEGAYRLTAVSGQLGVTLLGLGGIRGSMLVPDPSQGPEAIITTGDLQWWRAAIIIRIKDVHVFYNYQYYDSRGIVGEIPGQELPQARYHFGLKWEFWN